MPRRISIERLARNLLDQRPQHNKIDVAVDEPRPRRLRRRLGKRHPVRRLLLFPRRLQIQIRLQPRVVRQQLPHRDVLLPILRKLRQILRHRIIHPHLALLHQLHHRSRSRNHLGQRRQIEHRIERHRLRASAPAPDSHKPCDKSPPRCAPPPAPPREVPIRNRLLNDGVDCAESHRCRGSS